MNDTYKYVCNRYFKKATRVIDKFHVIKLLTTAVNKLRIETINKKRQKIYLLNIYEI